MACDRSYEAHKTGFEEEKDFKAPVGTVVAGRYEVRDYLGSAAFSSAYSCFDHEAQAEVCLKVAIRSCLRAPMHGIG